MTTSYEKDLEEFKSELIRIETSNEERLKKAARALEEAGTVETHKISRRIWADLYSMRSRGFITLDYIKDVLPKKYQDWESKK